MAVEIKQVETRRELREFIRFNYRLYKDNPYAVPDLLEDMLATLGRRTNPALEFCDAAYFLAKKDGQTVGRVAAIINRRANEIWKERTVRFGWIDFIDDPEVSSALIETVADWGSARGMETIEGPLGFTDMDSEGCLIEGFEELSTMATIYNYPYYAQHFERLGMEKAADWIELNMVVPDRVPERLVRMSDLVSKRLGLHVRKIKSIREVKKTGIGYKIFDLINESFSPLFGFVPMTKRQIDQYVKTYLQFIDLRMVSLVETAEGELVAVGISMPSLSRTLQKAHGRLLPWGWFHFLKTLVLKQYPDTLDLLLVGVRPDYQNKGVNALLFTDLIPVYQQLGFKYVETNIELEQNRKVQSQWQYFETRQHKRRRCYRRLLRSQFRIQNSELRSEE